VNPVVPGLYTIKDDAGNQWYLLATQSPVAGGAYTYTFQAAALGAVLVTPNTITTPVTIVDGVTSVNNPLGAINQGISEETDQSLRIRFHASTANLATGFPDSLEATLKNLAGVKSAIVYENDSGSVDGSGTPGHSIWAIIEGGVATDIAQAIYSKKSGGCGMRGTVTQVIARPNGQTFTAKWDVPNPVDIYVHFAISLPGGAIDAAALAQDIVNSVDWLVGGDAIGSTITAYLLSLNAAYRVSGMGISSDNSHFVENLISTSPSNRFIMDISRFSIS
jgi:uncharacterized phage protein gp47/JayE